MGLIVGIKLFVRSSLGPGSNESFIQKKIKKMSLRLAYCVKVSENILQEYVNFPGFVMVYSPISLVYKINRQTLILLSTNKYS